MSQSSIGLYLIDLVQATKKLHLLMELPLQLLERRYYHKLESNSEGCPKLSTNLIFVHKLTMDLHYVGTF